jgi:hypothetical protein
MGGEVDVYQGKEQRAKRDLAISLHPFAMVVVLLEIKLIVTN